MKRKKDSQKKLKTEKNLQKIGSMRRPMPRQTGTSRYQSCLFLRNPKLITRPNIRYPPLTEFLEAYRNLPDNSPAPEGYSDRINTSLRTTNIETELRQFLFIVLLYRLDFERCRKTIFRLEAYSIASEQSKSTQECRKWIINAHKALQNLSPPVYLRGLFVNSQNLLEILSPIPETIHQSQIKGIVNHLLISFGFNCDDIDTLKSELSEMIRVWQTELSKFPNFWRGEYLGDFETLQTYFDSTAYQPIHPTTPSYIT